MTRYYRDYVWKNGFPYGIQPCLDEEASGLTYKLVADPYNKRVTIEKYSDGSFAAIIYDSALFDFRHLKLGEQLSWQKTLIQENENSAICHIRNQDDRLVLIEEYHFEESLCRECRALSPLGNLISVQKMSYAVFNDPFNGVTLYDSNEHSVMSKHYKFDDASREFTELLKEQWHFFNTPERG